MARYQVNCINKTDRTSAHERISHIGGLKTYGSRWRITEDRAITGITNGLWEFYVSRNGSTVDVIVATRNGIKYLKTQNDGEAPDNLLSLPECDRIISSDPQ